MSKEYHLSKRLIESAGVLQKKLRWILQQLPRKHPLPLLIPAEGYGAEFDRFHNEAKALLPWNDKQTQKWAFTGSLRSSHGRPYFFQITFFVRHTQNDYLGFVPLHWLKPQTIVAHFALTDIQNEKLSHVFEYAQMGGLNPLSSMYSDDQVFHIEVEKSFVYQQDISTFILFVKTQNTSLHLELKITKPLIYHGQKGYMHLSAAERASAFACSYLQLEATGRLIRNGKLEPVNGFASLNHKKTTDQNLYQVDCDSIAIQFETGEVCYIWKSKNFATGSWINQDSSVQHLIRSDFEFKNLEYWISPKTYARYPIRLQCNIKPLQLRLEIKSIVPDQEIDALSTIFSAYWKGAIQVTGEQNQTPIRGTGFMELQGYDSRTVVKAAKFFVTPSLE